MRKAALVPIIVVTACTSPAGPYPSLQPRSAEAIDPRVPVVRPMNDRPVSHGLASRLSALVEQVHAGDAAFSSAIDVAEHLAAGAAAPQSERWIAAQEALTAAIAARRPTATALGAIAEIGATALRNQGGMAPSDLAAIESAQAQVGSIDRQQADRIEAIQKRWRI